MNNNEYIYIIFDEFKSFIKKNKPVNSDILYYLTAEISANLLHIVLLYLNKNESISNKSILKSFEVKGLINIMFNNDLDKNSKNIIKKYIDNVIPNKEHVWVVSLISEFLIYRTKKMKRVTSHN